MKVKIKCDHCPEIIEVESECNCACKSMATHSLDGKLHGLCESCAKKSYETILKMFDKEKKVKPMGEKAGIYAKKKK